MYKEKKADIFDVEADAIVNTVNCVGVMGKGIALEFRKRFPKCYEKYKKYCEEGHIKPGKPILIPEDSGEPNIILFPTKDHWRGSSSASWIREGIDVLRTNYRDWKINSIAMPRLGCGLGGLSWSEVKPLIEEAFRDEPLDVVVCNPPNSLQKHDKPPKIVKKNRRTRNKLEQMELWR